MGLDVTHLQGQQKVCTVKVEGGEFDVEYHPHAATRQWQTSFGRLQREQGDAVSDEDFEAETEIHGEITERLQELIISWDLQSGGDDIPVSADGLDMISVPLASAIFEQVLTDASGGTKEERKKQKKGSRRR